MIKSFRHRGLKRFHDHGDGRRLPPDLLDRIELLLSVIDTAICVEEIDLPSMRLHRLTGDRKGQWSVTVRSNWRITFRFENGQAEELDFVDYH